MPIKSLDDMKRLQKLMEEHGEEEGLKMFRAADEAESKGVKLNPSKVKAFQESFAKS